MSLNPLKLFLATAVSSVCLAQTWEVGIVGGYGWYRNPSLANPPDSGSAGFPSRAAVGVVFGQDRYNYISGELRWLFRFGGPQLDSHGIKESATGYTNTATYDFLFHLTPRESDVRPFVAAGMGIKAFKDSSEDLNQPLAGLAVLRPIQQVEPAISVGGDLKYRLPRHVQLRVDFRTLMSPLPDRVIRTTSPSMRTHGWVYDFVPLGGISYAF
jgi:hypothetical protein